MEIKNTETYVTFKWMLAQTLALIVSVATVGFLMVSSIAGRIDSGLAAKVSLIQFEERTKSLAQADTDICKIIEQFTKEKIITNDRLSLIEQHLAILVGKPVFKAKDK